MPDRLLHPGTDLSRRLQEVAPGEYAEEVYPRDAWSAAVGLGRAYLLGTTRLSLGLAGAVRILIANPADSGVMAQVLAVAAFSTGTGWAIASRNPAAGLPTSVRESSRLNPHVNGGPASPVTMYADVGTTELTGGTDQVSTALPSGVRTEIGPLGFVLAPGESLGIQSSFGAAADLVGTAYVVAEPL